MSSLFERKQGEMNKSSLRFFLGALALFLAGNFNPQQSEARDNLVTLFHKLKNVKANYGTFGTVCEEVARLEVQEEFRGPGFEVETGIEYSDKSRTIGELDVIVFDTLTDKVIMIAEVKCWRDLKSARQKARKQLTRFQDTIASHKPINLYLTDDRQVRYEAWQFDTHPNMIAISQEGGEAAGFEDTIEYSLAEMQELQKMLQACQEHGQCD